MLGYTCLSDIAGFPDSDEALLRSGQAGAFDAFVNVGDLDVADAVDLTRRWPHARIVDTGPGAHASKGPSNVLSLPADTVDKWAALSAFLSADHPAHVYPDVPDLGRRTLVRVVDPVTPSSARAWDRTPWVCAPGHGMRPAALRVMAAAPGPLTSRLSEGLGAGRWAARDDTFPGNLSLFAAANVTTEARGVVLTVREEDVVVRASTAGAVATVDKHLHGRFAAEIRPAAGPGLVTGMFLQRNGPRQEIDVEFLGRDTTKLLANVFYNPGRAGTRLE